MRQVCARTLNVVLVAAILIAAAASSASAAGDPALERRIVRGALPGWTPLPDDALARVAAVERGVVSGATSKAVTVAVGGWQLGRQSILVVLLAFPSGAPPGDFKPRDAVIGACATATLSRPKSLELYPAIAGSAEAECEGRNAAGVAVAATVMAWTQQDVFALVIGNRMAPSELEPFAVKQDAALTATPSKLGGDGGSDSSSWLLFVIIGVVGAVGLAIVFLLIARSRSRMPAPVQALGGTGAFAAPSVPSAYGAPPVFAPPTAPPAAPAAAPGWQPVAGDPTRIAYWDGTRFTAWKRWDGSNWVD